MNRRPRCNRSLIALLPLALVAALGLSACGGSKTASGGTSTPAGAKQDKTLRALLPQRVRQANVIRIASNAPYAPFVSFKSAGSKEFVGLDVDLARAIGNVLGVRVEFFQLPFDSMIPAVKSGKYDAVMGGLSDTKAREQVLDFVDYNVSGLRIIVPKGNPDKIRTLADLCGKSVSAQAATEQADKLDALNKTTCASNKVRKIAIPQEPDAQLAVKSGRAKAELTGALAALEAARRNPDTFEAVNDPAAPHGYAPEPNAIGVRRDDVQLRRAIQKALQKLMDDGTELKILKRYQLGFTALKKAQVNGG